MTNISFEKNPIIAPFLINGLILWEYVERASQFEQFLMMSDEWAWYTPIKFERL